MSSKVAFNVLSLQEAIEASKTNGRGVPDACTLSFGGDMSGLFGAIRWASYGGE
jgi:hypothetical protein